MGNVELTPVTVEDAAALVRVSTRTIRRWIAAGRVRQNKRGEVALEDCERAKGRARSADPDVARIQEAMRATAREDDDLGVMPAVMPRPAVYSGPQGPTS